jgi:hypothetical protein
MISHMPDRHPPAAMIDVNLPLDPSLPLGL